MDRMLVLYDKVAEFLFSCHMADIYKIYTEKLDVEKEIEHKARKLIPVEIVLRNKEVFKFNLNNKNFTQLVTQLTGTTIGDKDVQE